MIGQTRSLTAVKTEQVYAIRPIHASVHVVSSGTSLLNVALGWRLILADEVFDDVLAQPAGKLDEFRTEAVDRLLIHVGLSNQLWQ